MTSIPIRKKTESLSFMELLSEAALSRMQSDPGRQAQDAYRQIMAVIRDKGYFADRVTITPELAALLLERNADNRPLKPHVIALIVRDLLEGRYRTNGETVILSDEGELNDGQNRLWACVQAGLPMTVFVAGGLPRETRMSVDSNQTTKTPGDYFAMRGILNGHHSATISGYLWQIEKYGEIPTSASQSWRRPTKEQLQEFQVEHAENIALATAPVIRNVANRIYSKALLGTALYHIREGIGHHEANDEPEKFISALMAGGLPSNDPVHIARERLMDDKSRKRSDLRTAFEIILRAWNYHARLETITRYIPNGTLPKVEPVFRPRPQ